MKKKKKNLQINNEPIFKASISCVLSSPFHVLFVLTFLKKIFFNQKECQKNVKF